MLLRYSLCQFLLLVLTQKHVVGLSASSSSASIRYRNGRSSDVLPITLQLAKEIMNPLGVQVDRFVVAYDVDESVASTSYKERIGWAQLRPLPGRQEQIERETDDVMWDEFEADRNVQVPVGLQSLPWTSEYREFADAAAAKRRAKREQIVEETTRETPVLYELSSVWVDPSYRERGVGAELVRRVLERHVESGTGTMDDIYLLTLSTTSNWYRKNFGFQLVDLTEAPDQMAFEVQIGNVLTKLFNTRLVCMKGDPEFEIERKVI